MGIDRLSFPDKKLFNKHEHCLELFGNLDKIQNRGVRDQLEIIIEKLNTVLMRVVASADQGENANRQVEEGMAMIDSLSAQVDEFLEVSPADSIYLNKIKDHANTKILTYLRKSVKK